MTSIRPIIVFIALLTFGFLSPNEVQAAHSMTASTTVHLTESTETDFGIPLSTPEFQKAPAFAGGAEGAAGNNSVQQVNSTLSPAGLLSSPSGILPTNATGIVVVTNSPFVRSADPSGIFEPPRS